MVMLGIRFPFIWKKSGQPGPWDHLGNPWHRYLFMIPESLFSNQCISAPEPPWIQCRLDRINSFYLNPEKFDTLKMCIHACNIDIILVQQWVKMATYAKKCILRYSMHLGASGILSINLYQPGTTLLQQTAGIWKKGHPKDRISSI